MITAETLAATGRTLFGTRWQHELAHALDVDERTMRRWAAGSARIPIAIHLELAMLCQARGEALVEASRALMNSPAVPIPTIRTESRAPAPKPPRRP